MLLITPITFVVAAVVSLFLVTVTKNVAKPTTVVTFNATFFAVSLIIFMCQILLLVAAVLTRGLGSPVEYVVVSAVLLAVARWLTLAVELPSVSTVAAECLC